MERKNFIKTIIAAIFSPLVVVQKKVVSVVCRKSIDRRLLAEAMVMPIRRQLHYQGIGRKLLMVEQLPKGALARYGSDACETARVITEEEKVDILKNYHS